MLIEATSERRDRAATASKQGFAAYFRFVDDDRAAFRLLFGASARNDPEFADVVDGVLDERGRRGEQRSSRSTGSAEHRLVLAHAVVGMAEGISRHALTDPDGPHDPDQLANWVAELAWFGLRGVRSEG